MTAQRLLVADSWQSVSMDRVAREAGVSKGLVTYYYKSKDELIIDVINRYHAAQEKAMRMVAEMQLPPSERLTLIIELAFASREAAETEVKFQAEVWSFAKTRPDTWQAIGVSYQAFRAACAALLDYGDDLGYISAEALQGVYPTIHAIIDGFTVRLAIEPNADVKVIKDDAKRIIESLLTGGLR